MAKIERGRLNGVWGMRAFTSLELFGWATELEAQANSACNIDDAKWLRRRAGRVRQLAARKERAQEQKSLQNSYKPRGL